MAAGSGSYRFNLPVAARAAPTDHIPISGGGYLYDTSANDLKSFSLFIPNGATTFAYGLIHATNAGGPPFFVGSTTYPWASGDRLICNFTYEAGS
jgi:hypothetical protein